MAAVGDSEPADNNAKEFVPIGRGKDDNPSERAGDRVQKDLFLAGELSKVRCLAVSVNRHSDLKGTRFLPPP